MKRTNRKVQIFGRGMSFVRTVFLDNDGNDCFKHDGEMYTIYIDENGNPHVLSNFIDKVKYTKSA